MKEPFNILDFPTVTDDTAEDTVITNIPKNKKKVVKKVSTDPIQLFLNKNFRLGIEKYKQKCEEQFPDNIEELMTKYRNKRKSINEGFSKYIKENKLLKNKMGQVIQEKELFNLLMKFQNKKLSITVKSGIDYKRYSFTFEIKKIGK
jgi:hypothetical protein